MYADYSFYTNNYKGFLIPQENYDYFAERASDELAPYAARIGMTEEDRAAAIKKAQCRIADILFGDFKSSKYGTAKITSESVHGYYTAAFSAASTSDIRLKIAEAIQVYLGQWLYFRPIEWKY